MTNKLYNILSKIQRWLPSLGIFYMALCGIWGFPFGEQVNATIVAIATLLAGTLEIATVNYLKRGNANE